jgi:hypothetical protein
MFMVQHLFYFSRETLKLLLEKAGFRIEEVTTRSPWYFQSALGAVKMKDYFRSAYFLYTGVLSLFNQGFIMSAYARKLEKQ